MGAQRLSVVFAMINSQQRADEFLEIGRNSSGTALETQAIWAESLEAQYKELNNTVTIFWQTLLDEETLSSFITGLTGIVDGATKLLDTFGTLPTSIFAVSSAYMVFNKQMREGVYFTTSTLIPSLSIWNTKMMDSAQTYRTNIDLAKINRAEEMASIATLKAKGLSYAIPTASVRMYNQVIAENTLKLIANKVATVALQGVLSLGLSVAISGAISLFQKFVLEMETTEEKVSKTIDSLNDLRSGVEKAVSIDENLIRYETLSKELQFVIDGSEKQQKLLEEIESIRQTISSEATSMEAIINNENLTLEKQLALLREINKERLQEDVDEFKKENKQKNITKAEEGMFYNLELWKGQEEALRQARESGSDYANWGGQLFDVQLLTERHEELTEKLKSQYTNWEEINSQIEYFKQYGIDAGLTLTDMDEATRELLDSILLSDDAMGELEDKTVSLATVSRKTPEQIQALNKAYVDACSNLEETRELLDDINENGMTLDNANSVLEMFDDFTGKIDNASQVQDFLNEKIKGMADAQSEAYQAMIREDEEFWSQKMKNSDEWQSFVNTMNTSVRDFGAEILGEENQDYINFMAERAAQRELDFQNAKTMGEAERILSAGVVNDLSEYFAGLVDDKGVYRGIDYSNVIKFLNDQGTKEAETVQQLRDLWNIYYTNKAKALDTELRELDDKLDVVYEGDRENIYSSMAALNKENDKMQNLFADMDASFTGVSGTLTQQGTNGLSKPTSGSSSSSSNSKEVEDLKLEIDRYYELADALNDVEKALKKNQTLQKTATGREKIKLMKQEIELYKQQQEAVKALWNEQKKEASELRKQLEKHNFKFDTNGDILNYEKNLMKLQNNANKKSGEAKKSAIEAVEAVVELIEQYNKLNNETIPDSEASYLELMDVIKSAEKERLEYIQDVQDKIAEAIKSRLEEEANETKKHLEKMRDLYNSEFNEETYQSDLKKEQRKLDELKQQIANISRDTSLAGQLKLQQLLDEYEAQQEVINNMIRDNEHQKGDQAFQDAIDEVDEKLEQSLSEKALAELVNQALTKGFINLNGEIIETENLLTKMLEDSGDLFKATGQLIKDELIDSLQVAKSLMSEISSFSISGVGSKSRSTDLYTVSGYDLTTDVLQNRSLGLATGSMGGTSVSLTFDNLLNIQGNLDHTILGEVQTMLDHAQNQIINKVSRALSMK